MNYDSFTALVGTNWPGLLEKDATTGEDISRGNFSILYSKATTIEFAGSKIDGYYWRTYLSPYGTWLKASDDVVVFSAYQDGPNIVLYPAKIRNGYYKIAAYNGQNDSRAAAVIRSQTKNVLDYVRRTTEPAHYESTLDVENELEVAKEDINDITYNLNYYQLGVSALGKINFFNVAGNVAPYNSIKEGQIIFRTDAKKGDGTGDYLAREFNVIVVEPSDATAIQGVKEYVKSLNDSDAIYNLQGVRVKSTVKGQMYIQNGKKFIQK